MKIALENPPYCSSCFGQDVEAVHVDMEAYWDGPVMEAKGAGYDPAPIDDLVLCERCIREAYGLLPENAPAAAELQQLRDDYQALFAFAKSLQEANAQMAEAVDLRQRAKTPARAGKA